MSQSSFKSSKSSVSGTGKDILKSISSSLLLSSLLSLSDTDQVPLYVVVPFVAVTVPLAANVNS